MEMLIVLRGYILLIIFKNILYYKNKSSLLRILLPYLQIILRIVSEKKFYSIFILRKWTLTFNKI